MASQQKVAGRFTNDVAAMKYYDSNFRGLEVNPASAKYSTQRQLQAAYPAACEDDFHDSGLFLDHDDPVVPGDIYEDFVLLDEGPPFIDELDASMIANHGSTYNGSNNERAARIEKYTSYDYDNESPITSFRQAVGTLEQGVKEAVEGQRPPPLDRPSLFSTYEAITGPSMLSEWASAYHRHEAIACRFEQPPFPADRLQTPPPPAKRRRTQSGNERRRR